jgi:hypothetical protein
MMTRTRRRSNLARCSTIEHRAENKRYGKTQDFRKPGILEIIICLNESKSAPVLVDRALAIIHPEKVNRVENNYSNSIILPPDRQRGNHDSIPSRTR